MTTVRRGAPRLFTGAVFSEEISLGLLAFAKRHNLMSDIWVPKKLIGKLKNGVTLLPNAILCDVSLMPGCGLTNLREVGFDRLLVNAMHTTDQEFFEHYQNGILNGVCGGFPLTSIGTPHKDSRSAEFTVVGKRQCYKNPYWIKIGETHRHWINAEELQNTGRYNPIDCIAYRPHTFTNQLFPPSVALLMRRKASQFGYISRTWVTMKEGESHGTRLDANRMKDGPPIFTSCFSGKGNVQAAEYFCADQFEDSTVFPTQREIDLAASGVFIGANKVRSYPLIASLAAEFPPNVRHRHTAEATAKFSHPVLFGIKHTVAIRLLESSFKETLRKFSLLRGFSQPLFILHTLKIDKYLRLKPQEQGIVCPLLVGAKLSFFQPQMNCFFNVEQFEESHVVEELITRTSRNFLTQTPLYGLVLMECIRLQCTNRELSQMWISGLALGYFEGTWELLPGAVSVPKNQTSTVPSSLMYNISHVSIPTDALDWWPTYIPCDAHNTVYFGEVRMLLSLRAWEQRYTSPVWVNVTLLNCFELIKKRRNRRKGFLRGEPFEKSPTVLVDNIEFINIEEIKNARLLLESVGSGGKKNSAETDLLQK